LKKRFSGKPDGLKEAPQLGMTIGSEYHCIELICKASLSTRDAILATVSKLHETVKAYLMSQTPDAFPQSDVGTEIAPET
jgi:hypothetical protein